jgi:hypothetical protein
MFIAVAKSAPHDVSLPILGILATTVALATGMASMSLALTSEIGHCIVMCPKETLTLSFTFATTFRELDATAKIANRLPCKSSPGSSGSTISPVQLFYNFLFGHVGNVGKLEVFFTIIRRCFGVCAVIFVHTVVAGHIGGFGWI